MNNCYQFSLVLDDVDEKTPQLADALFEAGCDDALINFKHGVVYLDFDRQANTFEDAILSAIRAVESAELGATVVSVAPEHLVSLSDIAERMSITRQSVFLLMQGRRGAGNFPKPVLKIANKSPLWRWSAVAEWFYQVGKLKNHHVVDLANWVEAINVALEQRNNKFFLDKRKISNALKKGP